MDRVTRIDRPEARRDRALLEVDLLAWLLDSSIPVPGTGRRFGVDALIGLVPVVGDIASAGIGLFVVWRASRHGLPRIVVARMLANTAIDTVVGAIPILGDAFDLWFKANTRNVTLLRRHLERPDTSTRDDWLAVVLIVAAVVGIVFLVGWLIVSVVAALVGALS
jgi:hypothetical protein